MKKINKLILLLVSFIMCFGLGVQGVNAEELPCIQSGSENKFLIINGESIELINLYGATFVPFEPVAKYCNITLNKSGDKKYYFNKDGNNYIVNIGEPGNMKNGQMIYNSYNFFNYFGDYMATCPDCFLNDKRPETKANNFERNGFLYVSLEFLYKELKVPFKLGMTGGAIILGNEYNAQGAINEMEHEYMIVTNNQTNKCVFQCKKLSKSNGKWIKDDNYRINFVLNDGTRPDGWYEIDGITCYLNNGQLNEGSMDKEYLKELEACL